jgi:hypothetical protein
MPGAGPEYAATASTTTPYEHRLKAAPMCRHAATGSISYSDDVQGFGWISPRVPPFSFRLLFPPMCGTVFFSGLLLPRVRTKERTGGLIRGGVGGTHMPASERVWGEAQF